MKNKQKTTCVFVFHIRIFTIKSREIIRNISGIGGILSEIRPLLVSTTNKIFYLLPLLLLVVTLITYTTFNGVNTVYDKFYQHLARSFHQV